MRPKSTFICRQCARELSRDQFPQHYQRGGKYTAGVNQPCFDCRAANEITRTERRAELFWSHVDRSGGDDACWPWLACRDRQGYGKTGYGLAHRHAWTLVNGPIPDELHVLHRCDNPPCCNPAHHFLGTNLDNCTDRHAKGRTSKVSRNVGSSHGLAKLTEEDVVCIRALYSTGDCTQNAIAHQFGINRRTVGDIVTGKVWRHVITSSVLESPVGNLSNEPRGTSK